MTPSGRDMSRMRRQIQGYHRGELCLEQVHFSCDLPVRFANCFLDFRYQCASRVLSSYMCVCLIDTPEQIVNENARNEGIGAQFSVRDAAANAVCFSPVRA